MARVYIVEDNESIREAVASYLRLEDYEVLEFSQVAGVFESFRYKRPDLMVVDVMLPDGNGFALVKEIKKEFSDGSPVPVVFLTARESESDRILGFEIGADDYVTKPFSPKELVLRIKAILRRSGGSANGKLGTAIGGVSNIRTFQLEGQNLKINEAAHEASLDERLLYLTKAEWSILLFLSENSGAVHSRETLLGECLDYQYEGSERTIDTHIKNIRAKLGDETWIETIRGIGYRFCGKPGH